MTVVIRTLSALSSPLPRSAGGLCSASRSLPSTSPSLSGPYGSESLVARRTSLFTTSFTFALDDLLDDLLDAFLNAISPSHPLAILPSLSSRRFLAFASWPSLPPLRFLPVTTLPSLTPRRPVRHFLQPSRHICVLGRRSSKHLILASFRHPISASPPFDVSHLVSLSPSTVHTQPFDTSTPQPARACQQPTSIHAHIYVELSDARLRSFLLSPFVDTILARQPYSCCV